LIVTFDALTLFSFGNIKGWNSWNRYHCNINEDLIRKTAAAMVSTGLKAAGYNYVVSIFNCRLRSLTLN